MSTFRNPVGPQPSSVYWRRRIVVGLALLAVIVIVLLIFFQPKSAPTKPSATNTPSTSETAAAQDPSQPCAPGTVTITAATDKTSYAPGENPQLSLSMTNKGAVACTINAGTSQQEYRITSGTELYWDSKDCQTDPQDLPAVLQPNQTQPFAPLTWDRTRSSPTTCGDARPQVPAGGASYHLNVSLGDLKSNDVQFILN